MTLRKKIAIIITIALSLVGSISLYAVIFLPKDNKVQSETQTVMIYMMGSDLESQYGMASLDMKEIEAAGIDTDKHNIILYVGGSIEWQNDVLAEGNYIYKLDKDEFKLVNNIETKNMGEADTFSEFLSWTHENYKSDSYGLVLWNHGGGPNVGYGADEKYNYDCLTLEEMKEALENSPFNENNKLEWVSFDACLMASVELAENFEPYANYLIASQESEPSFGHNYKYLSCLSDGELSGAEVGKHIASEYMSYYNGLVEQEPRYECDITISCMDLSKFGAVKTAMDELFDDATVGVDSGDFSNIKRQRARAKSFGKYTTSNSYDLVDLYSLADNMSDLYISAKNLTFAIEQFIIINEANVPDANGVSIYYPFDNIEYQSVWMEDYEEISPSDSYMAFLRCLTESNDVSAQVANIDTDVKYEDVDWHFSGDNVVQRDALGFSLKLTEEQNAYVAYATCTIVEDVPDEEYEGYQSPCAIAKKVLCDENSEFFVEIEKYVIEMNDETGAGGTIFVDVPETDRELVQVSSMLFNEDLMDSGFTRAYINLKLSENGSEYNVLQAIRTESDNNNESYVSDKKYLDIMDYEYIRVMWPIYGITCEDDGTVKPYSEWEKPGIGVGYEIALQKAGIEFKVVDIAKEDESKFHAVFVVTDVYGNRHMSPLIELK